MGYVKYTIYKTCAILHRFHNLYISRECKGNRTLMWHLIRVHTFTKIKTIFKGIDAIVFGNYNM